MLPDVTEYRYYAFRRDSAKQIHQAAFDRGESRYEFGYRSIRRLTLERIPGDSDVSPTAMLHDGKDFRFYFQAR